MQRHINSRSLSNVETQGPTSQSFDEKYLNTLWAIDQLGRVPDCFGISMEACLVQFSQADGQLFDRSIQILNEIDRRLAMLTRSRHEINLGRPDLELLYLRHKIREMREWQCYHNRSNVAFWENLRASTMKWVGPQRYLHEYAKKGVKCLMRWKIPSACPDQPPRSSNLACSTYSNKRQKKSVHWDIGSGVNAGKNKPHDRTQSTYQLKHVSSADTNILRSPAIANGTGARGEGW
jgi:hypothetical protein